MPVQDRTDLSVSPSEGSFVRRARRAQLVDAAITAIAELGLTGASTVVIARRAGVSRGVLTYHFRDRRDLLDAVVTRVYEVAREHLVADIATEDDPRAALRAFVGGSVAFYARFADHMAALSAVFAGGDTDGTPDDHARAAGRAASAEHGRELDEVGALLTGGVRSGVFRKFDVPLMAASVRGVLDVALTRVRAGDHPAVLAEEIVATVDAMTVAR